MVVGQELCRLSVRLLRYIIHLRPQAGVADRQIVLGAMARAVGAFASRLAAWFVALDERTPEDRLERRQLAKESVASFPQGGSALILRELECGSFSVAREWTDWADPPLSDSLGFPPQRLDAQLLLELVTLLEVLTRSKQIG